MQTIILMNKGKRPWTLKNAEGETKIINSMGTIELDETVALRLLLDYPRDFIKASEAGTSSKDIARMEQSLRDRSANLDARSDALDAREKALDEREKALAIKEAGGDTEVNGLPKGPSGEPPVEGQESQHASAKKSPSRPAGTKK